MAEPGRPVTPADIRLHGAGDGSVMAYCGACDEWLPILPRPATLEQVMEAYVRHADTAHRPHLWPGTDIAVAPPL